MKTTTSKAGSVVATVITLSISSFALAACGGSGSGSGGGLSPEDQALADAISQDSIEEGVLDESQSQCFGDALVQGMGADRLAELGVTVDNPGGFGESEEIQPTDADANKVVDAYEKCADLKALLTEALATSVSSEAASCVTDGLSNEQLRSFLVFSLLDETPPADEVAKLQQTLVDCEAT